MVLLMLSAKIIKPTTSFSFPARDTYSLWGGVRRDIRYKIAKSNTWSCPLWRPLLKVAVPLSFLLCAFLTSNQFEHVGVCICAWWKTWRWKRKTKHMQGTWFCIFWCCLFFKNIKIVKTFLFAPHFCLFSLLPVCSDCLAGLLPVTPALCMLDFGVCHRSQNNSGTLCHIQRSNVIIRPTSSTHSVHSLD